MQRRPAPQPSSLPDLDIAVIGAGFAGLAAAHRLKKAGYHFRVFEKSAALGGTWRDNRYPGCACDVPSHLYSLSFAPKYDWSHKFSGAAEIWAYMRDTAEKFGLTPTFRFNQKVDSLSYDEARQLWQITFSDGHISTARAVITGTGALHLPALPQIIGLSDFQGQIVHSAQWDDQIDLRDKQVAIIGTGASAIQIVPAIVDKVSSLSLFQRTPPWIVPRGDHPYSERQKRLFKLIPGLRRLHRLKLYAVMESRALGFVSHPKLLRAAEKLSLRFMHHQVKDKTLRKALTPDYRMGCKRILLSDNFYPALQKPNASLVTSPIQNIESSGIRTEDGTLHKAEILILATGFKIDDWLSGLTVRGAGNRSLAQDWSQRATAHYGITTAQYPNLFMLVGPNTGLGHNSLIFMIEAQLRYILRCLKWLKRSKQATIAIRPESEQSFLHRLDRQMRQTVWLSGCKSWYLNSDGSNSTIWPFYTFDYWYRCRAIRQKDFILTPHKGETGLTA